MKLKSKINSFKAMNKLKKSAIVLLVSIVGAISGAYLTPDYAKAGVNLNPCPDTWCWYGQGCQDDFAGNKCVAGPPCSNQAC